MIRDLPTDAIDIRADARAIDEAAVAGLVESIANVGLINPIRVRAVGDRWEVIAGAHRLTAVKQLGLADISAIVVTDDDLHAELAMIDENLCRAELSPSDRAKQTARRKAIYLELHPETAAGVAGAHASNRAQGNAAENFSVASFAKDTAAKTGTTDRLVRLNVERGENVIDAALDIIRGTKLDTGSYLDKLKKLSPSEQVYAAKRDLNFIASQERDEKRHQKKLSLDADIRQRAAKEVAELIAEYVPADAWEHFKSNMAVTTSKEVLTAFTNISGASIIRRSAA